MQIKTLPLEQTNSFSNTFLEYVSGNKELSPFYNVYPAIENFKPLLEARKFDPAKRELLYEVLTDQYSDIHSPLVEKNIEHLRSENTFTITTGHQLNIFTGPLYFIYKIVSVINTCKRLKEVYPDYHFVPVYWMASEDHDFEEISHFYFDGKKTKWETSQTGAVGRFDPKGLQEIANKLPKGASFFAEAYDAETLSVAVRDYVNMLFQDEGLVVLDADDIKLKRELVPVIKEDLLNNTTQHLVSETSQKLKSYGFKHQVNAREINFFYLEGGMRERIEKKDSKYEVVNTTIKFSEHELLSMLDNQPERFSPNVILRPLYQEIVLPNLAYIGGPSEIVYWLQLKSVFDLHSVPFPALMPRNFGLVIPKDIQHKWEKTNLPYTQLFHSEESAFTKWAQLNTKEEISFSNHIQQIQSMEKELMKTAEKVDPTLSQHIEALHTSFKKKIETAEKKLLRAEKKKHTDKKAQIVSVKEALFPEGTLQERKTNFLDFYLQDPTFIDKLKKAFHPFSFQFYLLLQ